MSRKEEQTNSNKSKLGSSTVNLKDRLSVIKQINETMNQKKNGKENVKELPVELSSCTEHLNSATKALSVVNVNTQVSVNKKLTAAERVALRSKIFKMKMNYNPNVLELPKNIIDNNVNLTSVLDKNLPTDILSFKPCKEVSNSETSQVEKDIKQKRESSSGLRLQTLKKCLVDIKNKRTYENNELQKNKLQEQSFAGQGRLEGREHSIQDKLLVGKCIQPSLEPSCKSDLVKEKPVEIKTDSARPHNIPNILGLTKFDVDLRLLELKMKQLTIQEQIKEVDLTRKRILSYHTRLETLKSFKACQVNLDLCTPEFGTYKRQSDFGPVVGRSVSKPSKYSQQKKSSLNTSSSRDVNGRKDWFLHDNRTDESDHESVIVLSDNEESVAQEILELNRKRKLTYNTRLQTLKNFATMDCPALSASIEVPKTYNIQSDCGSIVGRPILTSSRTKNSRINKEQMRTLSTTSSLDINSNKERSLKNNLVDEKSSEKSSNLDQDIKSANERKNVRGQNALPSNDLRGKLDKLKSKSNSEFDSLEKDVTGPSTLSSDDLRHWLNKTRSTARDPVAKTSVTDIEKGSVECKDIEVEHNEIEHVLNQFPVPKQFLHNYYQILAEQLKDKSLKVEPLYKNIKTKHSIDWNCSYHLKWPENCKVSAQSKTKQKASNLAALRCLALLQEHGKISPDGMPLIYTKEEVKKITRKKESPLQFDDTAISKMKNIIDIFHNNMSCFVNKVDYGEHGDQGIKVLGEEEDVNLFSIKSPIYLGMHRYFSKEKVNLPISKLKEQFINLIQNNNCVIVKGEPGCGKSSRVPQYVLEAWARQATSEDQLCRIAVTQPRRIAAISLAERVASERDEELGRIVGYQVRLKSEFRPKTARILYCTTGILLRHLQSDPNLAKFSHVILDEAHERDVNTDLLINLLRKTMKESNLKVIVMSATLDAAEFSKYFDRAPIFEVPGFTYPVAKHFLGNCELDVSKTLKMCDRENPNVIHEDVVEILGYIHKNKPEGAILTFLPGWEDLVKVQRLIRPQADLVVHLVHSKLKDSEQYKIFSRPPPGVRKIILATNIAETSITIDDVVYVVDTGIQKDQIFDNDKGINVIDMEWISKASANQRAGRAGRCTPGESFHLYTKEKFNQFPDYSSPKILNSSLTKVVLDSKMFTNNMNACEFMNSLITPPEKIAVERAVDELKQLELLDGNENLTPLGKTLVNFQLEPSLAKAMVNGVVFKCTTPIVDIVTLFSSDVGIFGSLNLTNKDRIRTIKSQYCKSSDHLALMRLYEKWLELCEEEDYITASRFCRDADLVPYKMELVKKLKEIHFGYLYNGLYESMPVSEDLSDNDELVKAVLYSGTGTVLVHRNWDIVKNRLKPNANVLVTKNNHKATIASESVNHKRHKYPSDYLVYINETRSNIRRTTIVRECSLIPAVSVLLFSNKKLEILKATPEHEDVGDNMVMVGIKDTKLKFLCDKTQANVLIDCKDAIDASYKYLIHQLTYAGEDIPQFLKYWDNVLKNLGDILEQSRIQ